MAGRKAAAKSTAESTTRLTSGNKLRELLKNKKSSQQDADEAIGRYRQSLGVAADKHHLHLKAWAAVVREDKMEPEQLRAYYEHLEHYREELGLNKRAESAPPLPMEGEDEDAEEEGKGGRTVVRGSFPAPSSVAAE